MRLTNYANKFLSSVIQRLYLCDKISFLYFESQHSWTDIDTSTNFLLWKSEVLIAIEMALMIPIISG